MSASEEGGSVCAAGRDPREVLRQLQLEDGSFDVDLLQLEPGEEYGYASDNGADDEADIVEEQGTDSVIVVDNVPTVPEAKFDKLANVLRKIFSQVGTIRELLMPKDEGTGLTKGFAFIEFTTPVEAQIGISPASTCSFSSAALMWPTLTLMSLFPRLPLRVTISFASSG